MNGGLFVASRREAGRWIERARRRLRNFTGGKTRFVVSVASFIATMTTDEGRPPPLWICKTFYFVNSFGLASLLPFLPLFYSDYGLSLSQIGAMGSIRSVTGAVLTPVWTAFADAKGKQNLVHFVCLLVQASAYGSLRLVDHSWPRVYFYVLATEAFASCTTAFADSATGLMCRRWNKYHRYAAGDAREESYGKQRLWGAVSWGFVASPLLGVVMTYGKGSTREKAPFTFYFVFLIIASGLSWKLSHDPVEAAAAAAVGDVETITSKDVELENFNLTEGSNTLSRIGSAEDLYSASRQSIPRRLWNVVRDPAIAIRFFLFLMAGASMTITDVYLFLWVRDCGGSPAVMGVALFCTCVTEVIIFYNQGRIKAALSLDWCLILTPFAYAMRQIYYWFLPSFGTPWAVLPVQFLHGVTFGLYWSTSNDFIQEISPPGLTCSMTGLFNCVGSLGSFLGSVFGGLAYQKYGGGELFLGIGTVNLALGAFFTTMKLKYGDRRREEVAYVRLENAEEDEQ